MTIVDAHRPMIERWLTRLLEGRECFLFLKELGPGTPVSSDPTVCLRLFRPWIPFRRPIAHRGRIGIPCSVTDLSGLMDRRAASALLTSSIVQRMPALSALAAGQPDLRKPTVAGARHRAYNHEDILAAASYAWVVRDDRATACRILDAIVSRDERHLGQSLTEEYLRYCLGGDAIRLRSAIQDAGTGQMQAFDLPPVRLALAAALAWEVLEDRATAGSLMDGIRHLSEPEQACVRGEVLFLHSLMAGREVACPMEHLAGTYPAYAASVFVYGLCSEIGHDAMRITLSCMKDVDDATSPATCLFAARVAALAGEDASVRQHLSKARELDPDGQCACALDCASAWETLAGDAHTARELLRQYEAKYDDAWSLCALAEQFGRELGDPQTASLLLDDADGLVQDPVEQGHVTDCRVKLLGQDAAHAGDMSSIARRENT